MERLTPRPINPSLEIYFEGFTSNLYTLGQAGWEVHANQDYMMNRISVGLTHPSGLIIISRPIDFDFIQQANQYKYMSVPLAATEIKFEVKPFRPDSEIITQDFSNFQVVESVPNYIQQKIVKLEDHFLFRPKKELLVEPASVQDMMNEILKQQSVTQKELREKHRKAVRREIYRDTELISHCHILSVVSK